jgi:hypothetical protein
MNRGKDLTEVRSPQRQLAPDIVGLEQGKPTSLRGITNMALSCAKASTTEVPDSGTARPNPCSGRRVTGVPTGRHDLK